MLDVANARSFETLPSALDQQRPSTLWKCMCSHGGHYLGDVLEMMGRRIVVHELEIENLVICLMWQEIFDSKLPSSGFKSLF